MTLTGQVMTPQRVSIDPKKINEAKPNLAGILQEYGYTPKDSEWLAAALNSQGFAYNRSVSSVYGAAQALFNDGYAGMNRLIHAYVKSMVCRQAMKDDSVKAVYDFIDSLHRMKRETSDTTKALIGDNSMAVYILKDCHHVDPDDAPTYSRTVTKTMDEWICSLPIETLTNGTQTVNQQFSTLSEMHEPMTTGTKDDFHGQYGNKEKQVMDWEMGLQRFEKLALGGGMGECDEYYTEMVNDYQWVLDFVKGMTDEQHDMLNQFAIWGHRMGTINGLDLEKQFYAHFFGPDLDTNHIPNRTMVHAAMSFLNDSVWFVERLTKGQPTKKSLMAGDSAPHQIEIRGTQVLNGGFGLWWNNVMTLSIFHQSNPDVKCIRSTPNNTMYYPMDIRAVQERLRYSGTIQLAHIQPLMGWVSLRDFSRAYMTSLCDEALRLRDIGLAKQKVVEKKANKATHLAINESMDTLRQIYENLPVETYNEGGVEKTRKTMTTVDYSGRVQEGATGVETWLYTCVGQLTDYLGALAAWDGETHYPRLPNGVNKHTMGYVRGQNPERLGYEETQYEGLMWSMAEFGQAVTCILFEGWETPLPNTPFDFTPRIKATWKLLSDENVAFLRPIMVSMNDSMRETQKQEAINAQKAVIEQAQTQFLQSWEETEAVFTRNNALLSLV